VGERDRVTRTTKIAGGRERETEVRICEKKVRGAGDWEIKKRKSS